MALAALTEQERIELWRIRVLTEAGYDLASAASLAVSSHVDLHAAVELLRGGCEPRVAVRILL